MNVRSSGMASLMAMTFVVVIAFGLALPKSADAAYQYGIGASICGNDPFIYCGNVSYGERDNGQWRLGVGGDIRFGTQGQRVAYAAPAYTNTYGYNTYGQTYRQPARYQSYYDRPVQYYPQAPVSHVAHPRDLAYRSQIPARTMIEADKAYDYWVRDDEWCHAGFTEYCRAGSTNLLFY